MLLSCLGAWRGTLRAQYCVDVALDQDLDLIDMYIER